MPIHVVSLPAFALLGVSFVAPLLLVGPAPAAHPAARVRPHGGHRALALRQTPRHRRAPRTSSHRGATIHAGSVVRAASALRDTTAPTVPSNLVATAGNAKAALSWSASTDNVGVRGYRVFRDDVQVRITTSTSYTDASVVNGHRYSYTVSAYDLADNTSARSRAVSVTPAAGDPISAPAGSGVFGTEVSGAVGLPRADAACAAQAAPGVAQSTSPVGVAAWSNDEGNTYWTKWIAKRDRVTGRFTGTTDQTFRWAACKWGIDENVLRAVAVQESEWQQSALGDYANGAYHSFGIMQVRNTANDGAPAWGGYPDTRNKTPLNLDFYAANMRSCLDGDFYDGGAWLYNGQTIRQVIAAKGSDYALWGCVGSWFSGGWYDADAKRYTALVKQWLAAKTWLGYSSARQHG